ncbi:MAG: hypothetical protein RLZZ440_266 [Planctomycetota bacterium]
MTSRPVQVSDPFQLCVAGLLAIAGASTAAAEPAARPRAHLQSVAEIATPPASAQGLGVTLSRATAVLRRQLGIGRGAGLVADQVRPGSAAARAGFLQHDVLVRLDDQILVLPDQFDALLEAAEPEDPLACTVLRGGREVVIPLGSSPAAQAQAHDTVRPATRAVEPARPTGLRPTASSLALIAPAPRPAGSDGRMRELAAETLVRNDPDFQIRLSRAADTLLTVTDPSGRVVFQGAIDSLEDRGRMPAAVRLRVADMEKLLEPRGAAGESHVVPASAVATPETDRPARIGQLDVSPVELR